MACSACSNRLVAVRQFAPVTLAGVLALALVGCQTTEQSETTAAPGAASRGANYWRHARASSSHRADPTDSAAAIRHAQSLRESGQGWQAVAVLERTSLHNPKHRGVLAAYGRALAGVGDYQQAFDVLDRVHTFDRPDWRVLSVQGAVLDQMGRHEEAQRYYGTALRMAPNEPSVLSNLGLSYALSKDLVRAETTLRKAATQSRVDPSIRQNLALVMGLQGRLSETDTGVAASLSSDEAAANSLRRMLARQNGWMEWDQPDQRPVRAEGS